MAEVLGRMDGLELRQDEQNREYWVDTENGGRIAESEALSLLGKDPDEKQKPVEAVWHRQDTGEDIRVKITGIQARNKSKEVDLLEAEGMTTPIPRDELVWLPREKPDMRPQTQTEANEAKKSPEIKELNSQIEELRERVSELARTVENLAEEIRKMREDSSKKQEEPPKREDVPKTLSIRAAKDPLLEAEREEEELRKLGFKINQKVGVRRGRTEDFISGYEVAGIGETDKEGRLRIRVSNTETGREFDYYPFQLEDEKRIAEEHRVRLSEPGAADRSAAAAAATEARRPLPANSTRRVDVYERTGRNSLALGAAVLSLFAGGVFGVLVQENLLEGPEPPAKTITVPPKVIVEGNGIHKVFKSPNGTVIIKTGQGNEENGEHEENEGHAETSGRSVYIGYGEGYTQAIQDLYPGRSGSAYYRAYNRLMDRIGPNALKGVGHYIMPSGNWGLSHPGWAHFTRSAAEVLNKFFANK